MSARRRKMRDFITVAYLSTQGINHCTLQRKVDLEWLVPKLRASLLTEPGQDLLSEMAFGFERFVERELNTVLADAKPRKVQM